MLQEISVQCCWKCGLFNRDTWRQRDCDSHRQHCGEVPKETTKTNIRRKESELGVRYSLLLSLPYFDPVRFTVIDIMHNLFLGTGKPMFKTWLKLGIFKSEDLDEIDRRCSCFQVPSSIGKIPINAASNYGGFKGKHG